MLNVCTRRIQLYLADGYVSREVTNKVDLDKLGIVHQNILHFTIGGNMAVIGDRNPAVWIIKAGTNEITFLFVTALDGNRDHREEVTKDLAFFQDWIHVEISQKEVEGKYVYNIFLNKMNVYKRVNTDARDFDVMKLYLSDPWHPPVPGLIRNMYIEGELYRYSSPWVCPV